MTLTVPVLPGAAEGRQPCPALAGGRGQQVAVVAPHPVTPGGVGDSQVPRGTRAVTAAPGTGDSAQGPGQCPPQHGHNVTAVTVTPAGTQHRGGDTVGDSSGDVTPGVMSHGDSDVTADVTPRAGQCWGCHT